MARTPRWLDVRPSPEQSRPGFATFDVRIRWWGWFAVLPDAMRQVGAPWWTWPIAVLAAARCALSR